MHKHLFGIFLLTFFSSVCAGSAKDIVWDYPGQQGFPFKSEPVAQSQWQPNCADEGVCCNAFASRISSAHSTPESQRKSNTVSSVEKALAALQLAAASAAPRTE